MRIGQAVNSPGLVPEAARSLTTVAGFGDTCIPAGCCLRRAGVASIVGGKPRPHRAVAAFVDEAIAMKAVLLFFLMIMAAVILGIAIAVWYLSRFVENGGSVRKLPSAMPFPEKHRPVDVTPKLTSVSQRPPDAATTRDSADVDGLMRRLAAIEAEQDRQQPTGSDANQFKDDLKRIGGIGPKLEQMLNANGIFSFRQIAAWQEADIQVVDKLLPSFHGRIQREDWVGQAKRLHDEKGS